MRQLQPRCRARQRCATASSLHSIRVPYANQDGDQNSVEMRIYLGQRQFLASALEILLDNNQNVDKGKCRPAERPAKKQRRERVKAQRIAEEKV